MLDNGNLYTEYRPLLQRMCPEAPSNWLAHSLLLLDAEPHG